MNYLSQAGYKNYYHGQDVNGHIAMLYSIQVLYNYNLSETANNSTNSGNK